jgi:hypothetical protein
MAAFYVLPPRDCLDRAVTELFTKLLPGLPLPVDAWAAVTEHLAETASWPADLYLVPRDDLPDGEPIHDALASSFGAETGDRVVEVRLAGSARASVVGMSVAAAAR